MRTIVTTMRNEAPFILEWLAYHRLIGFTDVLVYTNDCDDGTDAMLDRLAAMGLVEHLPNPRRGKRAVQWQALNRAIRHRTVRRAEWIWVGDVDEFLCIRPGGGTLDDLFAARPDAEGFSIPWRMFGNAGVEHFDDAPVIGQFTRCAPDRLLWPWRAVQYKTLFSTAPGLDRLGVHKPALSRPGRIVDGSGRPVRRLAGTVTLSQAPLYDLAQINHYALGSIEHFVVKSDRGKPNHSGDETGLAYWSDRNFCVEEDRTILRHLPAVEARIAEWMEDPELARLHRAGCAWRRARLSELLLQSDTFYLAARLRQMQPTRVLPWAEQVALLQGLFRMRAAEKRRAEGAARDAEEPGSGSASRSAATAPGAVSPPRTGRG